MKVMNLAIIPARGGSTRIPKKNIKSFLGEPIITYSIKAALESRIFSRIIVSTDSEEIAAIAQKAGAETPFLRSSELSKNHVNIADVVRHALSWLKEKNEYFKYTCCILATAPFLQGANIREGYETIQSNDVDSAVSVVKFSFPIFRAFKKDKDGRVRFIWPEYELKHSNELPDSYHDAGQFYWMNTERFLSSNSIMGREVLPVVLPDYVVQDIDTKEDWETAEMKYEICKRKGLL